MDSIRLQAKRMYELQDYIDAQCGGPGKGWYRIVRSPWQARRVINAGKMAVVMGIETSVPFGCTFKRLPTGDVHQCDPASIDRQLDEVHALGVRQMELVNKFDNALSGVAGDNGARRASSSTPPTSSRPAPSGTCEHCEPPDARTRTTRTSSPRPTSGADQQDALFGAIGQLFGAARPAGPAALRPRRPLQRSAA